jgi:hypothetical protein
MARVKNVGELDWAMYGLIDAFFGIGFATEKPIRIDDTEVADGDLHTYEFQMYLTLDQRVELHPGTYESVDMVEPSPTAVVVDADSHIDNWDLKPQVITEKLVGLFTKFSKEVELLRVATRHVTLGKVSIWFAFLTKELPESPDKYLHALARKLSRLARKK